MNPFSSAADVSVAYQLVAYQVCPDSRMLEKDFLCAVASLEAPSNHPIATEIVQIARLNNILPIQVSGFQHFQGRGVGGLVRLLEEQRPRAMLVGSRDLLIESGLQIPELLERTAREWEAEPSVHLVYGGWEGWVRGILKFIEKPVDG